MATLTKESLAKAARILARSDHDLARLHRAHGVPPLWGRRPGFSTLVRIILEQQVSLASARAAFGRLKTGVIPLTPQQCLSMGVERLRGLGITRQKSAYCVHLTRALCEGDLDLRAVAKMDDAAAKEALVRTKGIGPWTADIYLLMALRRPDVWPSGDIALINTMKSVKHLDEGVAEERLTRIATRWRPYRAVAARMLWQHYLHHKGRFT
ncbi:DNA-3-methyladenine glycosylase family protein [Candidatus Eisenbacteria bacterium]|uniref:DNA-3-methyladenine glycosylase II n=1 Tax=Eiseniibacteriota bacterium TaxID=2212470 RepID=A0ABV6YJQ6_UNCEI